MGPLARPKSRDASRRRPDVWSKREESKFELHPEQLPVIANSKVNRFGPPVVGASLGEEVGMALGLFEGKSVGRDEGEVLGESVELEEGEVLVESVEFEEGEVLGETDEFDEGEVLGDAESVWRRLSDLSARLVPVTSTILAPVTERNWESQTCSPILLYAYTETSSSAFFSLLEILSA
jgi:hypothetical protein